MNRHSQLSRRRVPPARGRRGCGRRVALPSIIPARVLGNEAPSGRIRVAQIGCGRIGHGMDMPGVLGTGMADYVAVCDYDSKRAAAAKNFIEGH